MMVARVGIISNAGKVSHSIAKKCSDCLDRFLNATFLFQVCQQQSLKYIVHVLQYSTTLGFRLFHFTFAA